jgi:hypothetical protein
MLRTRELASCPRKNGEPIPRDIAAARPPIAVGLIPSDEEEESEDGVEDAATAGGENHADGPFAVGSEGSKLGMPPSGIAVLHTPGPLPESSDRDAPAVLPCELPVKALSLREAAAVGAACELVVLPLKPKLAPTELPPPKLPVGGGESHRVR